MLRPRRSRVFVASLGQHEQGTIVPPQHRGVCGLLFFLLSPPKAQPIDSCANDVRAQEIWPDIVGDMANEPHNNNNNNT